ncbi:MAG TPA: M13 family metallopeptidase [Mucilaginibacter sp.]|nr:M13 family metallopeptidase [Mucilaginibacter sp.]
MMKIAKQLLLALPAAMLIAGCSHSSKDAASDVPKRTVFFDKSGMDTTVNPADNFFMYVNGTWIKNTKIPPSETGAGGMYEMTVNNKKILHQILEDVSKQDNPKGSKEQKVGDLYLSGMDTVTLNKLGYDPVKPLLAEISGIKDYHDLINVSAKTFNDGDGFLFGFYVSPDDRNSRMNAAHFDQTGLGLPDRDYYFKTDSATLKVRAAYKTYIARLFKLTGTDSAIAAKKADEILSLETKIAQSHLSPVELRDPVKNYHKMSVADFQKQLPDIDLKNVFGLMNVHTDTVLVGQPAYYAALDNLIKTEPVGVWKDKLYFSALDGAASSLSKDFRDAHFDFYNKALEGQKSQQPRWRKMVSVIDNGIGELLGQLYVAKYFPPESKERMKELVSNLKSVYKSRIEKLDWMSPATKQKALEKLAAFTVKIGYPDKWKNYDDVEISRDSFYKNMQSIAKHDYNEELKKLGKPVDRSEWFMTPSTVDAYNNPTSNEIVFPAGILQFPFFDKDADDAINYGAIGVVIGHEMTHGFDDQGRQYDKDGNLKDWWTKEDAEKFKKRVQVLIDQYNAYTVLDNLHVNGSLTQGENLADNGGMAIAYEAFKRTPEGQSDKKIDGFTPDQRFFLSLAQLWRMKISDEATRLSINTNPHSPPMYRTNGPMSNMPSFYKAFNVKPGDKMYRAEKDRVKVW